MKYPPKKKKKDADQEARRLCVRDGILPTISEEARVHKTVVNRA